MDGLEDVLGTPSAEENAYFESRSDEGPAALPDQQPEPAPAATEQPQQEAPAVTTAEQAAPTEQAEQPKTVPLAALQEERRARQELAREIAELKARLQPPAEQHAAPTVDTDPIAVLRQTQEQLRALEEARQQEALESRFTSTIATAEAEFMKTAPDYPDAYRFLAETRDRQLQVMGIADPTARAQTIAQEGRFIAAQAFQAGQNPAERAYELAKAMGYRRTEPEAPKPTAPNPTQTVEQLAKATAAARSLSSASGGGAPSELTAETIANMSDDEFAKLSPAQFRKAMGG